MDVPRLRVAWVRFMCRQASAPEDVLRIDREVGQAVCFHLLVEELTHGRRV
jgi:hypothetical protein